MAKEIPHEHMDGILVPHNSEPGIYHFHCGDRWVEVEVSLRDKTQHEQARF